MDNATPILCATWNENPEVISTLLNAGANTEDRSKDGWYLEDGSGRATALVAHAKKFKTSDSVAVGFLGSIPDLKSSFMQKKYCELLLDWLQKTMSGPGNKVPQSGPPRLS
ncbi:MAG: hypothetical protein ABSF43_12830 [Rectinemataceae bacterium]|jgi:hypothetical protein